MIVEYHRPQEEQEALQLLARSNPRTIVLGGGLYINQKEVGEVAVVDLQALDFNTIKAGGKRLDVGAEVTLQALLDSGDVPPALEKSIRHQDAYNRRQVATVAGTLLAADGRSSFTTALLALDPILEIRRSGQDPRESHLGDVLPVREGELSGAMVSRISIPVNARLSYDYVARSPADFPLVSAAVAVWPSGRTRVVLGGFGEHPKMILDGPGADGAVDAAVDAYSGAGDEWASAEYRSNTAGTLVKRCLDELSVRE